MKNYLKDMTKKQLVDKAKRALSTYNKTVGGGDTETADRLMNKHNRLMVRAHKLKEDNMEDSAIQKVSPETRKMIMALRAQRHAVKKHKADKTKRLSVKVNEVKKERQFGWEHQKKIALATLKMSKIGAQIMGGMTHAQAKHFLDSNGINYDKKLVEAGKDTDDHYGPGASNMNKTIAALHKKLRKEYDKNEDENRHSENAVLLAKHFGTPEELGRMQHMLKTRDKIGHLHNDHIGWSHEMSKKYYHKLYQSSQHGGSFQVNEDANFTNVLPGDMVHYMTAQGQNGRGKVVIHAGTHLVINRGRGQPQVVNDQNYVKHSRNGKVMGALLSRVARYNENERVAKMATTNEDSRDVESAAQRIAIITRQKLLKNRKKKKIKKSIKEEVLNPVDWDNVETSHHSVRASPYGGIPLKHHVARLMAAGIQSKPTHSPYMYHNGLLVQAKHKEKANKILFGSDLPYNPMKKQLTTEVSAPGQEDWIKANKQRFITRYGKKKGTKILYAKAWKMSNQKESADSTLPPIHAIARGIRKNWKKEYFGAVPYLDAMHSLETAHDNYGADTGHSVIAYGLSNMSSYAGKSTHDPELAKIHRAQLKAHLKAPKPIHEALTEHRLSEGFKDLVRGIFSKKKEPKFFVHPPRKNRSGGVADPTKFMTFGKFNTHQNPEVKEARDSEFRANMHMGQGADLRKKQKPESKKPHNDLDAMIAIHNAMKKARQGGVDEATKSSSSRTPSHGAEAYEVHMRGKHIDTVWFTGYDEEEARKSLIHHDFYHPDITVRKERRKLKEASEEKVKKTAERAIQLAKKKIKGNQTANVKPELQVPAGNAVNSTLEGNHAEVGDGVSNHV